jgi:hypothetical protein
LPVCSFLSGADILDKAAAKGWELTDNNAGNFMWDGGALTRIDFDEAHVKRRKDGVTAERNR